MTQLIASLIVAIFLIIYKIWGKSIKDILLQLILDFILYIKNKNINGINSEEVNKHKSISDSIILLMGELGADRAYIFEFHNGSTFSSNAPIWKISCSYEHCRPGISYTAPISQNLLVSSIIDIVSPLWGKKINGVQEVPCRGCKNNEEKCPLKGIYEYDVQEMPESSSKAFLRLKGICTLITTPIIIDDQIVGLICLDYCTEYCRPENIHNLCQEATTISYLISKIKSCKYNYDK